MNSADANKILEIVSAILPVIFKYGSELVSQIVESIHKDPSLAADQLAAAIQQRLASASLSDAALINEK